MFPLSDVFLSSSGRKEGLSTDRMMDGVVSLELGIFLAFLFIFGMCLVLSTERKQENWILHREKVNANSKLSNPLNLLLKPKNFKLQGSLLKTSKYFLMSICSFWFLEAPCKCEEARKPCERNLQCVPKPTSKTRPKQLWAGPVEQGRGRNECLEHGSHSLLSQLPVGISLWTAAPFQQLIIHHYSRTASFIKLLGLILNMTKLNMAKPSK